MNIDFNRFLQSLQYMLVGMVCIFVVIGVIALLIYALNKVTAPKKNETANADDEDDE